VTNLLCHSFWEFESNNFHFDIILWYWFVNWFFGIWMRIWRISWHMDIWCFFWVRILYILGEFYNTPNDFRGYFENLKVIIFDFDDLWYWFFEIWVRIWRISWHIDIHYLDKSFGNHIFINYSKTYIITILEILIYDNIWGLCNRKGGNSKKI
jgi:hypothetical protein